MHFSDNGVENKRLSRTAAARNPNEIVGLGNPRRQELAGVTCRLWKRGFKTRDFVARGITGRSFWFSSFRPGYEVRDFSITPGSRDFVTPESRGAKGRKAPKTIRAWVGRDIARRRV